MLQEISQSFKYLFIENFPSVKLILWMLPVSFIYGLLFLYMAGFLKKKYQVRTGLTRKFFHFVVFGTAGLVQFFIGLPATLTFGGGISLVVLWSLLKGDEHILYEALARENDEPTRAKYIILPYIATLLGGLSVNLFFIPFHSLTGYLITGLGDAIGEPVGVKWGKHKYKVPSMSGFISYRSVEGSIAVLFAVVLVFIFVSLLGGIVLTPIILAKIFTAGIVLMLVEAFSPHGFDNFTTMIGGSLMSYWIF